MDTIFIRELKIQTNLGVPDWERLVPQTIILDIEIGVDLARACQTDAIHDTIDYGAVVGRIRETLHINHFKLVEKLAEHIAQLILNDFGALSVKIKVAKPAIIGGLNALGVEIIRTQS